jgi:hypothetical protein
MENATGGHPVVLSSHMLVPGLSTESLWVTLAKPQRRILKKGSTREGEPVS